MAKVVDWLRSKWRWVAGSTVALLLARLVWFVVDSLRGRSMDSAVRMDKKDVEKKISTAEKAQIEYVEKLGYEYDDWSKKLEDKYLNRTDEK